MPIGYPKEVRQWCMYSDAGDAEVQKIVDFVQLLPAEPGVQWHQALINLQSLANMDPRYREADDTAVREAVYAYIVDRPVQEYQDSLRNELGHTHIGIEDGKCGVSFYNLEETELRKLVEFYKSFSESPLLPEGSVVG